MFTVVDSESGRMGTTLRILALSLSWVLAVTPIPPHIVTEDTADIQGVLQQSKKLAIRDPRNEGGGCFPLS